MVQRIRTITVTNDTIFIPFRVSLTLIKNSVINSKLINQRKTCFFDEQSLLIFHFNNQHDDQVTGNRLMQCQVEY